MTVSVNAHRQAESLVGQAEALASSGQRAEAGRLYRDAALAELDAFQHIPDDRQKTRGIIAVSAVSMYFRAAMLASDASILDGMLRTAYSFLATGQLLEPATQQILDLIDEARTEQKARKSGRTVGIQGFSVSMRGPGIFQGVARMDLVLLKLRQLEHYTLRIGEFIAGKPFRMNGPVDAEVTRLCSPLVSKPASGSFEFEVRFEAPIQPSFFDRQIDLSPERMAGFSVGVIDKVANNAIDELEANIPDQRYRTTFLKQIRNIVPDGREVGRIEIRRVGVEDPVPAILTPSVRTIIQRSIPGPEISSSVAGEESGVLRAVHLNEGWIVLDEAPRERKCYIDQYEVFDDVVGPMMNQWVRVPGHWERNRTRFVLHDIVLDTGNVSQLQRVEGENEGPPTGRA
ncbi:MAG: hypothetical protein AB7R89_24330 [Dehalococcoidia bacterium]